MPFVSQKKYSWGFVAVWRIAEGEEILSTIVSTSDLESIVGIGSVSKRVERLSWRALLRCVMPNLGDVVYNIYGAPHVDGLYLSVSHNREFAVIAVSESHRCAIDVELYSRNFDRVSDRYISQSEEIIVGVHTFEGLERARAMCAVWCAKEVLYKYSGRDSLDFLVNLKILSYENSTIIGEIAVDGGSVELKMDVMEIGGSIIVVGIQ